MLQELGDLIVGQQQTVPEVESLCFVEIASGCEVRSHLKFGIAAWRSSWDGEADAWAAEDVYGDN
ncbi:MAG: hypothetical protein KDA57_20070 [Planctomycetales bacterium]|nr:hypothetical protein [Planctomycetales bacterium]